MWGENVKNSCGCSIVWYFPRKESTLTWRFNMGLCCPYHHFMAMILWEMSKVDIQTLFRITLSDNILAEKLNRCWDLLPVDMASPEIKKIPVCGGTHSYKEKSCLKEYVINEKHSGTSMQNLSVARSFTLVIFLLMNGNAPCNVGNSEVFISCATMQNGDAYWWCVLPGFRAWNA